MLRRVACPLVLLVISGTTPTFAQPAPADAESIERMRKDLFFLAGPECEGRGVWVPKGECRPV